MSLNIWSFTHNRFEFRLREGMGKRDVVCSLQRYLDEKESSFYLAGVFVCFATEYTGKIDLEALKSGLRHLCDGFPVLRSRALESHSKIMIYVPENYYPELLVVNGDKTTMAHEVAKLEGNRNSDLVRALLVHNRSGGYIILGIDHSIIDFTSLFSYYLNFWRIYTDLVESKFVKLQQGRSLPVAPSQILSERWGVDIDPATLQKFSKILSDRLQLQNGTKQSSSRTSSESPIYERHEQWLEFSDADTTKIRAACKSHKVGMTAFLGSAMATLLRERYQESGVVPMRFVVAVDLRSSVQPPIGATETTFLVSNTAFTIGVSRDSDPFTVAGHIREEFIRILKSRDDPTLLRPINCLDTVDVVLNGLSVDYSFVSPPCMTIADFFDPALLPKFGTARVPLYKRRPFHQKSSIFTYSFNGRLKVHVMLRSDLDKQEIIDAFMTQLGCVGRY